MGWRALLLGFAIGCAVTHTAAAAERNACQSPLSPEDRRTMIAAGKAVPLTRAIYVAKAKVSGEVVKAQLCRQDVGGTKILVYVLTVLSRSGKVVQARVDAADGHWLGGS